MTPEDVTRPPPGMAQEGPGMAQGGMTQPGTAWPRAVGICWQTGGWDPDRAIPEPVIRHLIEGFPACRDRLVFTLQPSATSLPVTNPQGCPARIADAAVLLANLDLVITVDTMVAHLAGALNRPTWLLLKHEADWRWMAGRDYSPWYPSMRLYRQRAPGDWAGIVERVARALRAKD